MIKKYLFITLLCLACFARAENLIDPLQTYVVIAGVLKWQDKSLTQFSAKDRKDKELYQMFLDMGIPKANITLLIDSEATKKNIEEAIATRMAESNKNATFIFYYAGHGVKTEEKYYFCNYDYSPQQQFDISYLSQTAETLFRGKRIILMADCCYSGALLAQGEKISKKGTEVIVLTSATSSNVSTGNWTFTQTLLDNFNGLVLGDRNGNGDISLDELDAEIKDAMKFREHQLSGFSVYGTTAPNVLVQHVEQKSEPAKQSSQKFSIGQYVYAQDQDNEWNVARIQKIKGNYYTVEFYNYSAKSDETVQPDSIHAIEIPDYSSYKKVNVIWEHKKYRASILKKEGDFYYIQYDDYDPSWNEWVMYDKIITGQEKAAQALWNSEWYPVSVLQERNGQYFISYPAYGHRWDEWVNKSRVKF